MSNSPKQAARSAAVRTPGSLESPMLSFDLNAEIEQLRREDGWQAGRDSKTLVKHPDFRVVLTVLKSGARLHEHRAAGGISVQTLTGHIRMHADRKTFDLSAGHLLALEREIAHDVEALEDSSFSPHHSVAGKREQFLTLGQCARRGGQFCGGRHGSLRCGTQSCSLSA